VKILLGVLCAFALTGVAYAAAAQLIVNGGTLQSGSAANLICDDDGVSLSYTLDGDNNVTAATVSDIDPACVGAGLNMVVHTSGDQSAESAIALAEDVKDIVGNDCDPKEITGDESAADPVECMLDEPTSAESIDSIDVSIVSLTPSEPEPTVSPTEEPTESPTVEPSETPTEEPTETPTEEPTETPTDTPTEVPTEAPTS
jgi:outer membrane biosynthesis protein TonB